IDAISAKKSKLNPKLVQTNAQKIQAQKQADLNSQIKMYMTRVENDMLNETDWMTLFCAFPINDGMICENLSAHKLDGLYFCEKHTHCLMKAKNEERISDIVENINYLL